MFVFPCTLVIMGNSNTYPPPSPPQLPEVDTPGGFSDPPVFFLLIMKKKLLGLGLDFCEAIQMFGNGVFVLYTCF